MPPDYGNVVDFMSEAYFKHDPAFVNIGLDKTETSPSLLKLLDDQIREGMTIIAENPDNCIIGAAVNAGSCPWDPDKTLEFARCCERGKVREILEFFAYVTAKPNLWERYRVLKIFECSCLAVDPCFQNLGIARRLLEESWYLARDCGYRLFRIDCTSRYSAKIAEAFGFECVCTIPFDRYLKNGEQVFRNIKEPHTEVQVYVDRLRFCEGYYLPYKKRKKPSAAGKKKK